MKLTKKDAEPTSVRQFRREMEHFFDDLIPFSWMRENGGRLLDTWAPASDITEDENEYQVVMDLPGIDKKDIKVNYQDGRLTITGDTKKEEKEEKKDFIRRERYQGSFYRSFTLLEPVKDQKIDAEFKDGILKVRIPKAEVKKPKLIDIK